MNEWNIKSFSFSHPQLVHVTLRVLLVQCVTRMVASADAGPTWLAETVTSVPLLLSCLDLRAADVSFILICIQNLYYFILLKENLNSSLIVHRANEFMHAVSLLQHVSAIHRVQCMHSAMRPLVSVNVFPERMGVSVIAVSLDTGASPTAGHVLVMAMRSSVTPKQASA